jgi:hypothetical protein
MDWECTNIKMEIAIWESGGMISLKEKVNMGINCRG